MRRTLLLLALAAALVGAAPTPLGAASPFDGAWTVLVITESGRCDRAYQYQVRIQNGAVAYAGGEPGITATGAVRGNGAISVKVGRGDQNASGSGRLAGATGAGRWRGGDCAGRWTAERRG